MSQNKRSENNMAKQEKRTREARLAIASKAFNVLVAFVLCMGVSLPDSVALAEIVDSATSHAAEGAGEPATSENGESEQAEGADEASADDAESASADSESDYTEQAEGADSSETAAAEGEDSGANAEAQQEDASDQAESSAASSSKEEAAETFEAGTLKRKIKTADGAHYTVTLEYDADAQVPEGSKLSVVRVMKTPDGYDPHAKLWKGRPTAAEHFVSEDEIDSRVDDLSKAIEVQDGDYVFYNELLDVSVTKGDEAVELAAPVRVTVETDAVDASESDAVRASFYEDVPEGAEHAPAVSLENRSGDHEDDKAYDEGAKLSFETDVLGSLGLAGVVAPLHEAQLTGMDLTVFGPAASAVDAIYVDAPEPAEGQEALDCVEFEAYPERDYGQALWIAATPVEVDEAVEAEGEGEQAQQGELSGYLVRDGELGEKLFGPEGLETPVKIESGDAVALAREAAPEEEAVEEGAEEGVADDESDDAASDGEEAAVDEDAADEAADDEGADTEAAADADEQATPEDKQTLEAQPAAQAASPLALSTTATSGGGEYRVSLSYGPEANIPEGATLQVRELSGAEYNYARARTERALDADKVTYLRAFDITILDADGNEVEPAAPVDVKISLVGAPKAGNASVVHLDGSASDVIAPEVTTAKSGSTLDFTAESFSVYAIAYTTDFFYKTAEGETYKITLNYGLDAGIPVGTQLEVQEITEDDPNYNAYVEKTAEALGKEVKHLNFARAFDITLVNPTTGEHYQPNKDVKVSIELLTEDLQGNDDVSVVHFKGGIDRESVVGAENGDTVNGEAVETGLDNAETEVMEASVIDGAVEFETDGFSVYVITQDTLLRHFVFLNVTDGIELTAQNRNNYIFSEQVLADGESLVEPPMPSKKGAVFKWWSSTQTGDNTFEDDPDVEGDDIVGQSLNPVSINESEIKTALGDQDATHDEMQAYLDAHTQYFYAVYDADEVVVTFYNQSGLVVDEVVKTKPTGDTPNVLDTKDTSQVKKYVPVQDKEGSFLVFRYWTEDPHGQDIEVGVVKDPDDPDDRTKDDLTNAGKLIITKDETRNRIDLYPRLDEAHYVYFDNNSSYYTDLPSTDYIYPEEVTNGMTVIEVLPSLNGRGNHAIPTANGYTFTGWYLNTSDIAGDVPVFKPNADGTALVAVDDPDHPGKKMYERLLRDGDLPNNPTLFAHWDENTESSYSIIVWAQSVEGGDKYDYVTSKLVEGADTGELPETTVDGVDYTALSILPNNGYGFKSTPVIKGRELIRADGKTVVNIYFDRREVVIRFKRYITSGSGYVYTSTNSDSPPEQYAIIGGDYVALTREADATFYTYTRPTYTQYTGTTDGDYYLIENGAYSGPTYLYRHDGKWWTSRRTTGFLGLNYSYSGRYVGKIYTKNSGTSSYTGQRFTKSGDTYTPTDRTGSGLYGLDENGIYVPLTATPSESYVWKYNGEVYTGQRYTKSTQGAKYWVDYKAFSGLYGQTFEQVGLSWPTGYRWYTTGNGKGGNANTSSNYNSANTGGTNITFLDGFLPTNESEFNRTLYANSTSGSSHIKFYKQQLNAAGTAVSDNYGTQPANDIETSGNGSFTITDKYNGFTAYQYKTDTGANANKWVTLSDPVEGEYGKFSYSSLLEIHFKRNTYTLSFNLNDGVHQTPTEVSNIPYEAKLQSYVIDDPQRSGYQFLGWFKDPEGKEKINPKAERMPLDGLTVYAGWAPLKNRVILVPNGGEMGAQGTLFHTNPLTNEKVNLTADPTRDYIKVDSNGTYAYDPVEGHYAPDTNAAKNLYNSKSGAYIFQGWYEAVLEPHGEAVIVEYAPGKYTWAYGDYVEAETAGEGSYNYIPADNKYVFAENGNYNFVNTSVSTNSDGYVIGDVVNLDTAPQAPLTLVAQWQRADTFRVVYDAEDPSLPDLDYSGVLAPEDLEEYLEGSKAQVMSPAGAPKNYALEYWTDKTGATYKPNTLVPITEGNATIINGEPVVVLKAHYRAFDPSERIMAKYVFMTNVVKNQTTNELEFSTDYHEHEKQIIAVNETLNAPLTPQAPENYVFKGWYYDKEGTRLFDGFGTVTNPVYTTLYAVFEHVFTVSYHLTEVSKDPNTDKVVYTPTDTVIATQTYLNPGVAYSAGTADQFEDLDTRHIKHTTDMDHYVLMWVSDWNKRPDGANDTSCQYEYNSMTSKQVTSDLDLYAVLQTRCYVDFDACGGKPAMMQQEYPYGSWPVRPKDPQREGCTFLGWYTDPIAGDRYEFDQPLTPAGSRHTLYAHWSGDVKNLTVVWWAQTSDRPEDETAAKADLSHYQLLYTEKFSVTAGTYAYGSATNGYGPKPDESSGMMGLFEGWDNIATVAARGQSAGNEVTENFVTLNGGVAANLGRYYTFDPTSWTNSVDTELTVDNSGNSVLNVRFVLKVFEVYFDSYTSSASLYNKSLSQSAYANGTYAFKIWLDRDIFSLWPANRNPNNVSAYIVMSSGTFSGWLCGVSGGPGYSTAPYNVDLSMMDAANKSSDGRLRYKLNTAANDNSGTLNFMVLNSAGTAYTAMKNADGTNMTESVTYGSPPAAKDFRDFSQGLSVVAIRVREIAGYSIVTDDNGKPSVSYNPRRVSGSTSAAYLVPYGVKPNSSSNNIYFYYKVNSYALALDINSPSDVKPALTEVSNSTRVLEYDSDLSGIIGSGGTAWAEAYNKTPNGYIFRGWSASPNARSASEAYAGTMPAHSLTLYAIWEPIEYTVTTIGIDENGDYFEANADGKEIDSEGNLKPNGKTSKTYKARYGQEFQELSINNPEHFPWLFQGWLNADTGSGVSSVTKIVGDMKVRPIWEKQQKYKVSYDANIPTGMTGGGAVPVDNNEYVMGSRFIIEEGGAKTGTPPKEDTLYIWRTDIKNQQYKAYFAYWVDNEGNHYFGKTPYVFREASQNVLTDKDNDGIRETLELHAVYSEYRETILTYNRNADGACFVNATGNSWTPTSTLYTDGDADASTVKVYYRDERSVGFDASAGDKIPNESFNIGTDEHNGKFTVTREEKLSTDPTDTRINEYVFAGWADSANATTPIAQNGDKAYVNTITDSNGVLHNTLYAVWGICKVRDRFGVEHVFDSIKKAVTFIDCSTLINNKTASIEMLIDYCKPNSDAVEVPYGCHITLTTATSGVLRYLGGERATITRAQDGASMFKSKGEFTVTNITLDGGSKSSKSCNENGGIISSAGSTNENASLTVGADAVLQNSTTSEDKDGGAIYVGNNCTMTMSAGEIKDCSATNGGAVSIEGSGSATVSGGTIHGCSATNGGAISVTGSGTASATVSGGEVHHCSATNGGAISVADSGSVTLSGGTIHDCSATEGGAISVADSGSASMSGGTISACTATNYGGAIYHVSSGPVSITGGTISGNAAGVSGGAVYTDGALNVAGTDSNKVLFSGNHADAEYGTLIGNNDEITLDLTKAVGGGAIFATGSIPVSVTNANFTDNAAPDGFGGAVCALNGATFDKADFIGHDSGLVFTTRNAALGGAIFLGDGTLSMADCNTVRCTVSKNEGSKNTGHTGGVIFCWSEADNTVTITRGIFDGHSDTAFDTYENARDGGMIYMRKGSLSISGATIKKFSAYNKGGAIYSWTSDVTIKDSWIYNCQAVKGSNDTAACGGAICNGSNTSGSTGGALVLDNVVIAGNQAKYQGGAIFSKNSVTLKNGTIIGPAEIGGVSVGGNSTQSGAANAGGIYFANVDAAKLILGADDVPSETSKVTGNTASNGAVSNVRLPEITADGDDKGKNLHTCLEIYSVLGADCLISVVNPNVLFWKFGDIKDDDLADMECLKVGGTGTPDTNSTKNIIGDNGRLYARIDPHDESKKEIIWYGQVVCRIVDEGGNVLYRAGEDTVYGTLVEAFQAYKAGTTADDFKSRANTAQTATAVRIEMLVDVYGMTTPVPDTATAGCTVTLTTAPAPVSDTANPSQYQYQGTQSRSRITMGSTFPSGRSMIKAGSGANLTLKNIVFGGTESEHMTAAVSYGAVLNLNSGSQVTLDDGVSIQYVDNTGSGAAVCTQVTNSPITMKGTSTIDHCTATSSGGGIYSAGTVTLQGSAQVTNCTANLGGGIYEYGADAPIVMKGSSQVDHCTATNSGGGILSQGLVDLQDSAKITNCEATKNGGGVFANVSLTMKGTTQVDLCKAGENGGGIGTKGSVELQSGAEVTNCEAKLGGGIYGNTTDASVTMKGTSTIDNCTATSSGGGILAQGSVDLQDSAKITNCTATTGNGGGVFADKSLTMNGTTQIDLCKAGGNGGGIGTKGVATLDGSAEVTNCEAKYGGGIYGHDSNTSLTMKGTTQVDNCTATSYGGGIFSKGTVELQGSAEVTNCEAKFGGGIRMQIEESKSASLEINGENVKISGNKAIYNEGKQQPYGGAISSKGANVSLLKGEISNNQAINSYDAGIDAVEAFGGAISISGGTLTVSGGTISGNRVQSQVNNAYGGAIVILDNATVTITGGTITGNTAESVSEYVGTAKHGRDAMGGAIAVNKGTLNLEGGTITGNAAIGYRNTMGGGISLLDGNGVLNIKGSPIFGTEADGSDGNFVRNKKRGEAYTDKQNGGEEYPIPAGDTDARSRQDIAIPALQNDNGRIVVTGDIGSAAGSIWVWAPDRNYKENKDYPENQQHYKFEQKFAKLGSGVSAATVAGLNAFRDAQDDDLAENSQAGLKQYLIGVLKDDDTENVYWGFAVTGNRRVILRKAGDDFASLEGAQFTLHNKSGSAIAWPGLTDNSGNPITTAMEVTTPPSGVLFAGEMNYGTYYLKETGAPAKANGEATTAYNNNVGKWYCVIIDKTGVYMSGGFKESGGDAASRTAAENAAKALMPKNP